MRGKIGFALGATVGYVLGSRAGRERYEQIKRGVRKLWNTGPVQSSVGAVRGAAQDRASDLTESLVRALRSALAVLLREGGGEARAGGGDRQRGEAASDPGGAA